MSNREFMSPNERVWVSSREPPHRQNLYGNANVLSLLHTWSDLIGLEVATAKAMPIRPIPSCCNPQVMIVNAFIIRLERFDRVIIALVISCQHANLISVHNVRLMVGIAILGWVM
jgi:hypothetical protein